MFCTACGHEVGDDSTFCSQCGTRLAGAPGGGAPERAEQLGLRTAPEECAYCGGDGMEFAKRCPACSGAGSVLVAQPARKCGACGGDGTEFAKRCDVCAGTGWAHVVRL